MPKIDPSLYLHHGPITQPGEFSELLDALPNSVEGIVKSVQGLFLHIFWAQRYGVTPDKQQQQHVQSRHVARILGRIREIGPEPLTEARPFSKRFFGNCRDFSVFTTAILRSKRIPARARCGFATYFWPGQERYEDHWVYEYWDGKRWVMGDAQLDEFQQAKLGIDFDPFDMVPGKFVSGPEAWQLCRSGRRDPEKFGIFDMHGLGFIGGNVLREVASLARVEMLPWDMWGLMHKKLDEFAPDDWALVDRVSDLAVDDDAEVLGTYSADLRLTVPEKMARLPSE